MNQSYGGDYLCSNCGERVLTQDCVGILAFPSVLTGVFDKMTVQEANLLKVSD